MTEHASAANRPSPRLFAYVFTFLCFVPMDLSAQDTGTVRGTVRRADNGAPVRAAGIQVEGTRITATSGNDGTFVLTDVPAGQQTIVVRRLGYRIQEVTVEVTAGGTHTVDVAFDVAPIRLSEIVVTGASRVPQRIVEAPAAISVVNPVAVRDVSLTGQTARTLSNLPGVDVVQSGIHDYNINARGFNSSVNRRVLVLQDGRDVNGATFGFSDSRNGRHSRHRRKISHGLKWCGVPDRRCTVQTRTAVSSTSQRHRCPTWWGPS